jgi:hypothetical protein
MASPLQLLKSKTNLMRVAKERQYPQKGEEVIRVRKCMKKPKKRAIEPGTPHALCLHVENGNIPIAKFCINDFQCRHCAFDQWLEAMEERRKGRNDFSLTRDILADAA